VFAAVAFHIANGTLPRVRAQRNAEMSKPRKRAPARPPRRKRPWIPWVGGIAAAALIVFIAMTAQPESAPIAADPAVIAEGKQLFLTNCAACHGVDLMGTETGPPFLHVYYAPNHHSDEAFQQAVAFGVVPHHWNFGPMDPVPGLTREDVAKIAAFVRSEQQAAGITRDPSHP
jgi:mono/diheme cytochrome c family protein